MKSISFCRPFVIAIFAIGMLVGCASTPEPAKPAGPSPAATQAIDAAKTAIAEAASMDALWRDTESFLKSAEEAAAGGDNETAIKLAKKARGQAEMGIEQRYLEQAKALYERFSALRGLTVDQRKTLAMAEEAIRNANGRKAYDLLTPR
jgi:hypothetical protein